MECPDAVTEPAKAVHAANHGLCVGQPRLQVGRLQRPRQLTRGSRQPHIRSGVCVDLRNGGQDPFGQRSSARRFQRVSQHIQGLPGARILNHQPRCAHSGIQLSGAQRRQADHGRPEFEGSLFVGQGTRLQTQIGYLDAKYDRFDDPRTALDPTLTGLHDHVAFSPKWTARLAATQTFTLPNSSALTLGGDVSWRDDTWLSVDNRPGLMQKDYTLVGLFGMYDSADGSWQLRAGVRNLTDEVYKTDAQEFSSVGNIQTAFYGWPRNYYVSARYNFF